ncbi:MAG: hypothetical protein ABI857_02585 [Acidobacteriota bacterium]
MELDFDKEIDTLLRKAHRDGPMLVGDVVSSRHLDADEISAFAENAMPENSRALYSAHLADCDRCRKILSNLLVMNAEAEAAPAAAAFPMAAAESDPWYRRLRAFPNVAYVMGSLVLVFAGFLGYTIVQNSTGDVGLMSQASETESTDHGPSFTSEPPYASEENANSAANAMSTAGSTTMNSNANAAGSRAGTANLPPAEIELREDKKVSDAVSPADTFSAAPQAATRPVAKDAAGKERDEPAKAKAEEQIADVAAQEGETSSSNLSLMRQQPSVGRVPAQSGPMRNNDSQFNRQMENMDERAKLSAKRDADRSSGRTVVSGKIFELKDGVWYDTAYQSRPTINVRRGTAAFNRLDAGLRSIANSLSGTAVIVWGAKAYRIQ